MPRRRFETWDSLDLGVESLTRSNDQFYREMESTKGKLNKLAEIIKNQYPPATNNENRIPSTSWGHWLLQWIFHLRSMSGLLVRGT
jgi:hypothetical protein